MRPPSRRSVRLTLPADDHPGHTDLIDLCAGVVRIWPMSEHRE